VRWLQRGLRRGWYGTGLNIRRRFERNMDAGRRGGGTTCRGQIVRWRRFWWRGRGPDQLNLNRRRPRGRRLGRRGQHDQGQKPDVPGGDRAHSSGADAAILAQGTSASRHVSKSSHARSARRNNASDWHLDERSGPSPGRRRSGRRHPRPNPCRRSLPACPGRHSTEAAARSGYCRRPGASRRFQGCRPDVPAPRSAE